MESSWGVVMSELLELAAKAMHHKRHPDFMNYTVHEDGVTLDLGSRRGAITSHWNPLEDDGDAFRLAVALKIPVWYTENYVRVNQRECGDAGVVEYFVGAPGTATRRAIVRATAEIGRAL